ncbi:phenylalanine--tRNA ligase subunit alpha [Candidatus Woesearchaeota archaeon]|nr:phenylalanine--tRNA ligase subunit alpha [Candidatus Woesearchaeota archaeon]
MPYVKKVKIKGKEYWYLFHTVREGNKYLKKSKYLGKELPQNIEEIKKEFLNEIKEPSSKHYKLIESLTLLERKVLPLLSKHTKLSSLVKETGLKEIEVMRSLQWLSNKEIIKIKKITREIIKLDKNGELYLKKGLPEKRFLSALDKPRTMQGIMDIANLDKNELTVSLGILKRKNLIEIGKEIKRLKEDSSIRKTEEFLKLLPSPLKDLDKEIITELKSRKEIIKEDIEKEREVFLTPLGKELLKENLKINLLESLTPEMLREKSFAGKKFRRYDIKINVPRIYNGRRHFVNQAIDYARRVWTDLGFKEMSGPIINTSFWNFDALFQPQDHPARDLQDSIFLNKKRELPEFFKDKVKDMHELGYEKSKGWQYSWDEEVAKKLVMRTHTTVLSALTLSELKKTDLPAKFFAIGKNFRNETVDWSHGFEFNQTEGIVIDPNANFRHLIGYLKEFFKKMGFENARFHPAYFPYTEPSVEIDVYHPIHKKWMELGGAGMFRPEVVIPLLGEDVPVLAWGPGFDRIIMDYYKIKDIRELYKNDLKVLREMKMWLR